MERNSNNYFSPFFVYILGFLTLFFAYSLRWSDLYPEMSGGLIAFILITCLIMGAFGILFNRKHYFAFRPSTTSTKRLQKWGKWYMVANVLELLYSRNLGGEDIESFGIPIFHIFVLSFGAFLSLMIFYKMLSDRKSIKPLIWWFLLSFTSPILVFGRGIIFMTLAGCLFLYLMSVQNIVKKIIPIVLIVVGGLFFFGVFGDIRIGAADSRFSNPTSKVTISKIGQATDEFEQSIVPHEFMWSYVYMVSPIGNLQHNINEAEDPEQNLSTLWELFSNEMITETIGKRISGSKKREEKLVIPILNVSTVYARPFVIFGWWGLILIFIYTLLYIFTVLILVPRDSEYFLVSIAIMNIILVFNLFDNMFTYGGYANVIFIPIIMSIRVFIKDVKKLRTDATR